MADKKTELLPWYVSVLGGGLGGVAAGLVGHPLDSIKVRLQSGASVFHGSLFNGLRPALGVQLTTTALLFGFYDGVKRRLPEMKFRNLIAGAIAGAMLAPATCYLEAMKCRAQAAANTSIRLGITATALRCGAGNAAFFHVDATDLTTGVQAGLAYWLIALPLDTIKSIQQVHNLSLFAAVRSLNLINLSRAYLPALMRAVPTSAACFLSVHSVRSFFSKKRHTYNDEHALDDRAFFFSLSPDNPVSALLVRRTTTQ